MNREIHIVPAQRYVSVDGTGFDKLDFSGLAGNPFADPSIHMVAWNGRDGEIQRKSKVPGRFNVEYFDDPAGLEPFVPLWEAEKQKRADDAYDQMIVAATIDNDIFDIEAKAKEDKRRAAEALAEVAEVSPVG